MGHKAILNEDSDRFLVMTVIIIYGSRNRGCLPIIINDDKW